jgi:hypothetical protein
MYPNSSANGAQLHHPRRSKASAIAKRAIGLRPDPGERHGTVSRALKERGLASTPSIDGTFLEDRGLWPVGGWVRSQHAHVDLRTDGRRHAQVRTRGLLTNFAPIQIKCTCTRKRRTGISLATLIYTLQCSDLPYRRVVTAPRVTCPRTAPNSVQGCQGQRDTRVCCGPSDTSEKWDGKGTKKGDEEGRGKSVRDEGGR